MFVAAVLVATAGLFEYLEDMYPPDLVRSQFLAIAFRTDSAPGKLERRCPFGS